MRTAVHVSAALSRAGVLQARATGGAARPTLLSRPLDAARLRHRVPRISQIRTVVVRSASGGAEGADPADARGAIALGLKLYSDGDYEAAYNLFTKVVKDQVPGTGVKRFRDKPPATSDGEKMAALYNIACCCSQTADVETGLKALAGSLERGFEDWETARTDPDLAVLREDKRFEQLLSRFEPSREGPFGWLQYQMDFKNSAIARVMRQK
mmetsp:Transcript_14717/g.41439  ORF Transcript_14717/g.41439 Transcript_14717/m.41439 type:complete len:211 (-) Transcript_14717:144-776(-)|eukprot:CAMPEP_0117671358 /NCGR_PEP_ID=MMETSP0804-20121206/13289_1 /TAXON_ID=1074897 /ORGANISM="Tetraselmis astigmatica, Strain CCMP880" /LENGTH=210 /DNA_ID=CAMNT_0005479809 /DNA_START=25 /DNA_END=657 /DNA_ORIENTATION=-